jgi:hypothetical protein
MKRLSFYLLLLGILLVGIMGGMTPPLANAQTNLSDPLGPGPAYEDPCSAFLLGVGSRRFAQDPGNWDVRYLDESAIPQIFSMEFRMEEQKRNRSWRLGYEGGDYTGLHYEIVASWCSSILNLSTFGGGVGRNYPFLGGQLVVRPVMALMYGNVFRSLSDIQVTTINMTVNGTDYPEGESIDMALRGRVLEARPRIDVLFRVFQGVAIRAHVGYDLSLKLHKGFLRFRGNNLSEEEATARENTDADNVFFELNGEPVSDARFPDYGLSGLSYGLSISYNLKHQW